MCVCVLAEIVDCFSNAVIFKHEVWVNIKHYSLKPLDIEVMKQLHEKVNIIPLISKADSMTVEECKNFKKIVSTPAPFLFLDF